MIDVTVIIPTFERIDVLVETLSALASVDYPSSRFEIIVVDDGSSSETLEAMSRRMQTLAVPVRLIRQDHRGPAAARNRGARAAAGCVLIFIDDDILVPSDFVGRHLQTLDENPGCWTIGRIVHPPGLQRSPFGRYRDARWEEFHSAQSARGRSETIGMSAANLCMPATDFQQLGGFDERFTIASCEDWDLGLRARAAGIRILYDPEIVVVHNDWAVDLKRFCERQSLYSISDVLLWRKYGERSPRAWLVQANGPIRWGGDPAWLVLKKAIKRVLVTSPGNSVVHRACALAERIVPDSPYSRRAYDLAVGVAIFKGVRDGLKRYPDTGRSARDVGVEAMYGSSCRGSENDGI